MIFQVNSYPKPPLNFLNAKRPKSKRGLLSFFSLHRIRVHPRGKRCRNCSSRSYNLSSEPRQEIRTSISSASAIFGPK